MRILDRYPFGPEHDIQGRVYVFDCGFSEAYFEELDALRYATSVIKNARKEMEIPIDYFIGGLWGDKKDRVIDVFGFSGVRENWQGNPDVHSWVVRNGVWRKENPITCGNMLRILGIEEEHRRGKENLTDYIFNPPKLNLREETQMSGIVNFSG